jgi:hypothetical protein
MGGVASVVCVVAETGAEGFVADSGAGLGDAGVETAASGVWLTLLLVLGLQAVIVARRRMPPIALR